VYKGVDPQLIQTIVDGNWAKLDAIELPIEKVTGLESALGGKAPSTHNHDSAYRSIIWVPAWSDVTHKPTVFPTNWANVADKPTSFTPSAHNHDALYRGITWVPSWGDVTGKPSTFTPSAHASTHNQNGSDALNQLPEQLVYSSTPDISNTYISQFGFCHIMTTSNVNTQGKLLVWLKNEGNQIDTQLEYTFTIVGSGVHFSRFVVTNGALISEAVVSDLYLAVGHRVISNTTQLWMRVLGTSNISFRYKLAYSTTAWTLVASPSWTTTTPGDVIFKELIRSPIASQNSNGPTDAKAWRFLALADGRCVKQRAQSENAQTWTTDEKLEGQGVQATWDFNILSTSTFAFAGTSTNANRPVDWLTVLNVSPGSASRQFQIASRYNANSGLNEMYFRGQTDTAASPHWAKPWVRIVDQTFGDGRYSSITHNHDNVYAFKGQITDNYIAPVRSAAANGTVLTRLTADSNWRWFIEAQGRMWWGDGTNALDTTLWRASSTEMAFGVGGSNSDCKLRVGDATENSHALNRGLAFTLFHPTQEIALGGMSENNFYPVSLRAEDARNMMNFTITSSSHSASDPWNNNFFEFKGVAFGWTDVPPWFEVNFRFYDNGERLLGRLYRCAQSGNGYVIYLRGGRNYRLWAGSRCAYTYTGSTVEVGNSVFPVAVNGSYSPTAATEVLNLTTANPGRWSSTALYSFSDVAGANASFTGWGSFEGTVAVGASTNSGHAIQRGQVQDWGLGNTAYNISSFTSTDVNVGRIFRSNNATGSPPGTLHGCISLPVDGTPSTAFLALGSGAGASYIGSKNGSTATPVWRRIVDEDHGNSVYGRLASANTWTQAQTFSAGATISGTTSTNQIHTYPSALGTTAGNTSVDYRSQCNTGNTSNMHQEWHRHTNGNNWETTTWRLRPRVDITDFGAFGWRRQSGAVEWYCDGRLNVSGQQFLCGSQTVGGQGMGNADANLADSVSFVYSNGTAFTEIRRLNMPVATTGRIVYVYHYNGSGSALRIYPATGQTVGGGAFFELVAGIPGNGRKGVLLVGLGGVGWLTISEYRVPN
jgi:hypothetical protein